MSSINDYLARVSGKTIKSTTTDNTRHFLRNGIVNSPSYFEVSINESSPYLYGVQIVDDSNVRDQKLITCLDHELKNGDIIDWQSSKWINILTDNMSDIYYRGSLRRCVGQLKWIDSNGLLKEKYFTFKSDSSTNFGVQDGRVMSLGNERRVLITPLDADTKKIVKDKRFIFDERAWKVSALDRISVGGLLILTLDEDEIDKSKDNLELGIADYTIPSTPSPEPILTGYLVEINGSESIKKNMSQTYIATVYVDGVINTSLSVSWELLDDTETTTTTLAAITSQNGYECIVKAGATIGQYVKLKVTVGNSSVLSIKRIQIKGLY
jgi:hypothetical protein